MNTLAQGQPISSGLLGAFLDAARLEPGANRQADVPSLSTPNPYPGLRAYNADISEVFVGRDEQIDQVLERLGHSQTVLVLGGSGCGKSSLLRGGVLPRLASTAPVPGRHGAWFSLAWRPEREPCSRLKDAFLTEILTPALTRLQAMWAVPDANAPMPDTHADLEGDTRPNTGNTTRRRRRELREGTPQPFRDAFDRKASTTEIRELSERVLDDIVFATGGPAHPGLSDLRLLVENFDRLLADDPEAPGANVLFVIDQFEEVFRPEVDRLQRDVLMSLIRYVYELKPPGVFLALVMRSEDLHRCAEEPHLPEIVNSSSMFVDWLDRAQLRRVIIEPAQHVLRSWLRIQNVPDDSWTAPYDPELVEELLDEADTLKATLEHKGDHLPLLQHGLKVLWQCATTQWRALVDEAEKPAGSVLSKQLRIGHGLLTRLAAEAEQYVRRRDPQVDKQRTKLQWLLAESAERALEAAEKRFHGADVRTPVVAEDAIRAAFCEMATLDENRRYYRKFRTVQEVAASRFSPENKIAVHVALSAALAEFKSVGLLTQMGSGAWDVSHEALIRNWQRLVQWVACDVAVKRALQEALADGRIQNLEQARALEPVLGLARASEYSESWAMSIALGNDNPGQRTSASDASRRLRRLRLNYFWIRARGATFIMLALAVVFSIVLAVVVMRKNKVVTRKNESLGLQQDLMRAYSLAEDVVTGGGSERVSSAARAWELENAITVWRNVRRAAGNVTGDTELEKDDALTEDAIDQATRHLLGVNFWIRTASGAVNSDERPDCGGTATQGAPQIGADRADISLRSGDGMREVVLAGGRRELSLYAKPNTSSNFTAVHVLAGLLPNAVQGGRVCLSRDGEVLTVAYSYTALPQIYDLMWYGIDAQFRDGAAAPVAISDPYVIPQLPLNGSAYHGSAPNVVEISPADDSTGERRVRFVIDVGGKTLDLIASYYEGYAAPERVSNVILKPVPCSPVRDSSIDSSGIAICEMSIDGAKFRNVERGTSGGGFNGILSNTLSRYSTYYGPGVGTVSFHASPVTAAEVMKSKRRIYLQDRAGEVWQVMLPGSIGENKSVSAIAATRDRTHGAIPGLCLAFDCR